MNTTKLVVLVGIVAVLLFLALPNVSWAAEDGAALYKANCAACHKADATGNPAMKAPALNGKTADDVKKVLDSNPKHAAVAKKLNADQVKAIGDYLAAMK
ncbi:MAG: c-type cytochrome [Terriglobales bacterium]